MRLITGLLLALVIGCEKHRDDGTTAPADPWVRRPPDDYFDADDRRDLAKEDFAVVTVDEAKAQAKLEVSPWVKLSPQEAEQFLGRPFPELNGQLVLLRALSLNELNGAYTVTLRSASVRVHHGSLGDRPFPINRRALIARLPALPSEVYVDCGMAE
jgi:hypothetical protein